MKIIKRGNPNDDVTAIAPSPEPWWIGRQATCPVCGAVVEIEDGDVTFPVILMGDPLKVTKVYADCPEDHLYRTAALVLYREED